MGGHKERPLLKIDKGQGFSYLAQSFSLAKYADDSEDNMKSPVILYEDLTPLGPAQLLRDIQIGLGRFAHVRLGHSPDSWRFVVFSTRDNSDPRRMAESTSRRSMVPFLYIDKGTPAEYSVGLKLAFKGTGWRCATPEPS